MLALIVAAGLAAVMVLGGSSDPIGDKTVIETKAELKNGSVVMSQTISIPEEEFKKSSSLDYDYLLTSKMSAKAEFSWGNFFVESSEDGTQVEKRKLDMKHFDCEILKNGLGSKCIQRDIPMNEIEFIANRFNAKVEK